MSMPSSTAISRFLITLGLAILMIGLQGRGSS
jgi:hypothetical protein